MRQFVNLSLFTVLTLSHLTAVPLASLLDDPAKELPLKATVRWEGEGELPPLTLLPDVPGALPIRQRFLAFQPEVTVEMFFQMDLPQGYLLDTPEDRRLLFTDIVNSFGKPETQVGYTYHSTTRNRETVLLQKSYISDRQGRRLDPLHFSFSELPSQIKYYQFIDEVNFSGSVFKQTLVIEDKFLNYRSINEGRLWFVIFPVVGVGDMRNELLIFIHDNHLYLYGCTQLAEVPVAKKFGFPIYLPTMFSKRMNVMARWLGDQLVKLD